MKAAMVLFTVLALVGCSSEHEPTGQSPPQGPVLKVSVLQSGKILLDGTEATIPQVERRLAELKSEGGAVWYYRQAGEQKPPPEAVQVIKLVTDNGLPISLSSKSDFSDYIGEDGQSHSRR